MFVRFESAAEAPQGDAKGKFSFNLAALVFIFVIVVVAIPTAGYLDYHRYEKLFRMQFEEQLSYVADLKAREISDWLRNCETEGLLITVNSPLAAVAETWFQNPSNQHAKADLLRWMEVLKKSSGYEKLLLLDRKSEVCLSVPPRGVSVSPAMKQHAGAVLVTGRPALVELPRDTNGNSVLSLFAPLINYSRRSQVRVGVMVAQVDPGRFFAPLTRSWPVPSRTAETLLVKREDDHVVYLTEPLHKGYMQRGLHSPMSHSHLPEVLAVNGREGVVETTDYRGVPVIAALRAVPDSTWRLVAKMDAQEIRDPLSQRARRTLGVVGLLILTAALSAVFYIRKQRLQFRLDLAQAALSRKILDRHYEEMAKRANDVLLLLDEEGRIIAVNDRAVATYGYSREEMLQLSIWNLKASQSSVDLGKLLEAIQSADGYVFEVVHRRKNGEAFPVEVSARMMEMEGRKYFQAVIRDITERKRIQEQIASSERKFRLLFERSNDGILLLDGPTVADCNVKAEELFGVSRAGLVGKKAWELSPDSQPCGRSSQEMALEGIRLAVEGKTLLLEWKCKKASGELFDAEISMNAVAVDGQPLVIVVLRDVTERVRNAEALRISEAKYRSLVENIPVITYLLTPDETFTPLYVNPQVEMLLGFRPEEILADSALIRSRLHPEDRERARQALTRVFTANGPVEAEYRIFRKDNTMRWLKDTAVLVRDEAGKPLFIQGVAVDVSGTKFAEEEIRKLSSALEHSPASVMITDAGSKIEYVNPRFTEVTGYSREEVIGRNPRFLQSGGTPQEEFDRLYRSICAGHVWHGEYRNRRKNGEVYSERAVIWPIQDQTGKITHFVQVSEDVSREKAMERQLQLTQKMETIGRIAGGIAHDLNNILTVIAGYAGLALAKLEGDASLKSGINEIAAAAERGASLTRQLLLLGREPHKETGIVELDGVIEGMQRMLRHLIGEKVTLMVSLDSKPGKVRADPAQIVRMVVNLAANAADAMPSGGTLRIETRRIPTDSSNAPRFANSGNGSYIRLIVSDTGVGMDEETQAHLFEPFFTTKKRGTGLGLSNVYGIVQRSGGHIEVSSEPGQGTTFTIWFPQVVEDLSRQEAEVKQDTATTATVLVVEDETGMRSLARDVLEAHGFKVFVASGRDEALRVFALHASTIDLLLVDVVMPEVEGHKLAEELIARRAGLKVLYMSGYEKETLARRGFIAAEAIFLSKPFEPAGLVAKVREVLEGGSAHAR